MDRTSYPFNNAAPRRNTTGVVKDNFVKKFPVAGAGEPLRSLSLSIQDRKFATSWEGSSAWFGDALSQTWGKDLEAEELAQKAAIAAQLEAERIANILPRAITGEELSKFGVKGDGKIAQIKRQYRSVKSSTLMTQISKHEAPERPEMLAPITALDNKYKREWLLVPKEEFQELTKLESTLIKENNQMSAQAALTVNRVGLSVVIPLPMSKMAVEDVCNRQMSKARYEVEKISKIRSDKKKARNRKKLGYDLDNNGGYGEKIYNIKVLPPPEKLRKLGTSKKQSEKQHFINYSGGQIQSIGVMYDGQANMGDSYQTLKCTKILKRHQVGGNGGGGGGGTKRVNLLQNKSIEARSMRYLEELRHEDVKVSCIEMEEMKFEEDIQRHADKYTEASERKLDYQWYYVLATRYGSFDEDKFNSTDRPGTLYLKVATKGAIGIQRLWRQYWPLLLANRFRAARKIQSQIRRYLKVIKWKPIIKFRCKYGSRKVKKWALTCYRANVKRLLRIQELMHIAKYGWSLRCLKAWRSFARQIQAEKMEMSNLVLLRLKRKVYF